VPDVIVVGGGVIGCATAYYLAQQGASVTLLERDAIASEASGAAAGMLAALSDEGGNRGPAFQQLCLDGMKLYDSLLPELAATGIDLRYRRAGVLHVALDDAEAERLEHRFETQRGFAPDSTWLNANEIRAEEPQIGAAVAGLLSPDEHYVDSKRLTEAFAAAATAAGAKVEIGAPVTRFHRAWQRLTGVVAGGRRYEAGAVVIAGGAWTAELARRLGANVPVRPVRGQMLSVLGPPAPLRHVVWGSRGYLVPREEGQTFVGATVEEVGYRKRTTLGALRQLRRSAEELVPQLSKARQLRAWAGLRPGTPDALPIMGLVPGWSNAWISTGHFRNGVLLAPISGRLMATSVLAGSPVPSLAPFSPTRFAE
jgi:glycine oxidase